MSASSFLGRHPPQEDGHQERRGLVVGKRAARHTGNEEVDGGAIEHAAIPFLPYQIDRAHGEVPGPPKAASTILEFARIPASR